MNDLIIKALKWQLKRTYQEKLKALRAFYRRMVKLIKGAFGSVRKAV